MPTTTPNMDPAPFSPTFNLYDKAGPCARGVRQYPPAKFVFGEPGRTGHGRQLGHHRRSHHLGSIGFKLRPLAATSPRQFVLPIAHRKHHLFGTSTSAATAAFRRAIIDRDVHIPEGTVIGYDPVEDKRRLTIVTTHRD